MADRVNVVSPDGTIGSVDASQAQEAVEAGFKLASPEQVRKQKLEDKYGDEAYSAFAAGVARDATLTLSDYILGAVGGDEMKQRLAAYKEIHPGATAGGEMLGGIGSALLSGGSSFAAKAGGSGARMLGALGNVAAKPFSSAVGRGLASGAVEGALFGGLYELSDQYIRDVPISGERLFSAAATGGLFGLALGGAVGGLQSGLEKVKAGDVTLMSRIGDGLEETVMVDEMLKRRGSAMAKKGIGDKDIAQHMVDLSDPARLSRAKDALVHGRNVGHKTGQLLSSGLEETAESLNKSVSGIRKAAAESIEGKNHQQVFEELFPESQTAIAELQEAADLAVAEAVPGWSQGNAEAFKKQAVKRYQEFYESVVSTTETQVGTYAEGGRFTKTGVHREIKLSVAPDEAYRKAFTFAEDLDNLARKVGEKNPALGERLRSVSRDLHTGNRGRKLFGQASHSLDEAGKLLDDFNKTVKKLEQNGLLKRGVFDKGYKDWLVRRKNGLLEVHDSEAGAAFLDYKRSLAQAEEFLEQAGSIHGVGEEYLSKIKKANKDMRQTWADLEELSVHMDDHFKWAGLEQARRASIVDVAQVGGVADDVASTMGWAGAWATGVPWFGPIGSVVGKGAQTAYRFGNNPVIMVEAAARVKQFLGKRAARQAKAIKNISKESIPSNKSFFKPTAPASGSAMFTIPATTQKSTDDYYSAVDTFYNNIGNKDKMREHIQQFLGKQNYMNVGVEEMLATQERAANFIMGLAWSRALGIKPTMREKARVFGAIQGIKWPERIVERTLSGQITRTEAQAFRAVHPKEFEATKKMVIQQLEELEVQGKTLPLSTRIRMAWVFDIKTDSKLSLKYLTEVASMDVPGQAPGNPQQAKRKEAFGNMVKMYQERDLNGEP